ncbi:hypothetical protein IC619_000025 [Hazenella sp. IB182353]|uniref:hypothetical protein n=1 Tax=Polycladospora coralii TaxID=2771432 RepID=UPI0017473643|nr:hypothetical protein [Polycladospora coralii]MBS7528881.1 hypothetical protein [Polycladospora coralii]
MKKILMLSTLGILIIASVACKNSSDISTEASVTTQEQSEQKTATSDKPVKLPTTLDDFTKQYNTAATEAEGKPIVLPKQPEIVEENNLKTAYMIENISADTILNVNLNKEDDTLHSIIFAGSPDITTFETISKALNITDNSDYKNLLAELNQLEKGISTPFEKNIQVGEIKIEVSLSPDGPMPFQYSFVGTH